MRSTVPAWTTTPSGGLYPRAVPDPAQYFHRWLTAGVVPGDEDGLPAMSFFHFERSWWDQQHRPNVLLVHYNDLKTDLSGEMLRVADFLDISVRPEVWPGLIEAAGFEAMHRDGETLMGQVAAIFQGGSSSFFHAGTNQRWRGIFRDEGLALYDAKVDRHFPPACARWVAGGRLSTGSCPAPASDLEAAALLSERPLSP